MSDNTTNSRTAQFLYDHPRMVGVLFTLMLLARAGPSAAGETTGVHGGT